MTQSSASNSSAQIKLPARIICRVTQRFADFTYDIARRLSKLPTRWQRMLNHMESVLPGTQPVIIDVGANIGQFASILFTLRPQAKVFSVDPIPENVQACREKYADRNGYKIVQAAVGEQSGPDVTFHVIPSANQSSSLLSVSDTATRNFRSLGGQTRDIQVPFRSLDDLLRENNHTGPIDLLKIDVEGFEVPVLKGATDTMARSKAMVIETQVQAMYKGTRLFDEVCSIARSNGFRFVAVADEIRDLFGDVLILDLLFIRDDQASSPSP